MTMLEKRICSIRCSETIWIRSDSVQLKAEELAALILLISLMIFTFTFVVVMKIFILLVPLFLLHQITLACSFALPCIDRCWNTVCILAKQHAQLQLSSLVMLQVVVMKEKKASIRQNTAYIAIVCCTIEHFSSSLSTRQSICKAVS